MKAPAHTHATMENTDAPKKSRWTNYLSRERRVFYMPSWLIVLWLAWICYAIGFRLAHVNQMNTIYKYTYLEPSYAPGNLTSGRNGRIYIAEIFISALRELVLLLTFTRLLFFRTRWIINSHMFLGAVFFLLEAVNAILIGLMIEKCNKEDDNPCNSYLRCAVVTNGTGCPQMYPDPVYPNTTATPYVAQWTPSTLTQDDLTWNLEFSISFFLALYMTLLAFFMWVISVLSRNPTKVITETYEMAGSKMTTRSVQHTFENTPHEFTRKFAD